MSDTRVSLIGSTDEREVLPTLLFLWRSANRHANSSLSRTLITQFVDLLATSDYKLPDAVLSRFCSRCGSIYTPENSSTRLRSLCGRQNWCRCQRATTVDRVSCFAIYCKICGTHKHIQLPNNEVKMNDGDFNLTSPALVLPDGISNSVIPAFSYGKRKIISDKLKGKRQKTDSHPTTLLGSLESKQKSLRKKLSKLNRLGSGETEPGELQTNTASPCTNDNVNASIDRITAVTAKESVRKSVDHSGDSSKNAPVINIDAKQTSSYKDQILNMIGSKQPERNSKSSLQDFLTRFNL